MTTTLPELLLEDRAEKLPFAFEGVSLRVDMGANPPPSDEPKDWDGDGVRLMKLDIRSSIDGVRGVREGDRKGDRKPLRGLRVEVDEFSFALRSRCSPLKCRRWLRPSALMGCDALVGGLAVIGSGESQNT